MISNKFNLNEFFNAIEGKPEEEALWIAHQEATEVERWQIKYRYEESIAEQCQIDSYLNTLKQFMIFLKSSIGMPKTREPVSMLYMNYIRSKNRPV
jgi:hypothetical protein